MVNTIAIFTGSTSRSLDEFFEILEKVSSKDKCVFARLNYKDLLDEDVHPLDYPLVIYTTDNYAFCIGDVSAGYSGTGPMGTKEILLKLGFDIDADLSSVTSHDFIKPDTDLCDKKIILMRALYVQDLKKIHVIDAITNEKVAH